MHGITFDFVELEPSPCVLKTLDRIIGLKGNTQRAKIAIRFNESAPGMGREFSQLLEVNVGFGIGLDIYFCEFVKVKARRSR